MTCTSHKCNRCVIDRLSTCALWLQCIPVQLTNCCNKSSVESKQLKPVGNFLLNPVYLLKTLRLLHTTILKRSALTFFFALKRKEIFKSKSMKVEKYLMENLHICWVRSEPLLPLQNQVVRLRLCGCRWSSCSCRRGGSCWWRLQSCCSESLAPFLQLLGKFRRVHLEFKSSAQG